MVENIQDMKDKLLDFMTNAGIFEPLRRPPFPDGEGHGSSIKQKQTFSIMQKW